VYCEAVEDEDDATAVCGFTSMIKYVNKINMINKTTTDKIY
jgi:hypothetical protein